jgi:outer membrane murein-binding lipoprotein Lpp
MAPTSIQPTVSGPPSVDPMSSPPGYAPVSGPTYPPMSGMPEYGQPAPRRGRGAMITLTILTVVFFLASAVLTGLYVTKSGAYDTKVNQLKSRDTQIASLNSQITDLNGKVKAAQDQLDAANQKQTGTQNQLDEVTKEKQVISNCLTLLVEALTAANAGDATTAKAKADAAQAPCTEAQKYLN